MKRTLEEAKAERRRRWAEREAKQPPREIAVYGLLSVAAMLIYGCLCIVKPSLYASAGLSCAMIVFAGAVAASWRWSDR